MSTSKRILSLLALSMVAGWAVAEPQRPLFTVENAFPRWEQVEIGATVSSVNVGDGFWEYTEKSGGPYLRYGLLEDLAATLYVPYVQLDPTFADSESGLGDVSLGFQLRAYEDIFGYPFIIPHFTVFFPTGDEDKGLGTGDPVYEAGISYGDKVYDFLTWVIDAGYRINPDGRDDQILLSTSLLFHISPQFTAVAEVRWEDRATEDEGSLVVAAGGFSYNWTSSLQMGIHAGTALSGDLDSLMAFRLSYSF